VSNAVPSGGPARGSRVRAGPPPAGGGGNLLAWVPQGVVFDCDGLLVDTEPSWTTAETVIFARRGRRFGQREKVQIIGRSIADASAVIASLLGEPGAGPDVARELLALMAELLPDRAGPRSGARRLVAEVASRVPVAVASNSPRALLDLALLGAGFGGVFEVCVAAEDVPVPKPAPDLYLRACRELGVPAGNALAFEDSLTGLRSALAAGLRTVGVPSLEGSALPAHLVVGSLADPRLPAWVATW